MKLSYQPCGPCLQGIGSFLVKTLPRRMLATLVLAANWTPPCQPERRFPLIYSTRSISDSRGYGALSFPRSMGMYTRENHP